MDSDSLEHLFCLHDYPFFITGTGIRQEFAYILE